MVIFKNRIKESKTLKAIIIGMSSFASIIGFNYVNQVEPINLVSPRTFEVKSKITNQSGLEKTLEKYYKKPVYFDVKAEAYALDEMQTDDIALRSLYEVTEGFFKRMKELNLKDAIVPMILHYNHLPETYYNNELKTLKKHYDVINKEGILIVKDKKREIIYIKNAEIFSAPKYHDYSKQKPKLEFIVTSIGFNGSINSRSLVNIIKETDNKGGFSVIDYPFLNPYQSYKLISEKTKKDLHSLVQEIEKSQKPILEVYDSGMRLWIKKANYEAEEYAKKDKNIIPVAGSSSHDARDSFYGGIVLDLSKISTKTTKEFMKTLREQIESKNYLLSEQYESFTVWLKQQLIPYIKSVFNF